MTREEISIRFSPVLDVALEAGRKLRLKLDAMKGALTENDEAEALRIAREIFGLKEQNQRATRTPRRRASPGING